MDELPDGEKPAFLSKETAEAASYPFNDTPPVFDEELPVEDDGQVPVAGVRQRYAEIARFKAIGKTNNWVCDYFGYTPAWVSTVIRHPYVVAEIKRYRDAIFAGTTDKLREIDKDGLTVLHNMVLDPKERSSVRADIAKWGHEQVHGKAKQAVAVEIGSRAEFDRMVREMYERGEVLDVTPLPSLPAAAAGRDESEGTVQQSADTPSKWADWGPANLK